MVERKAKTENRQNGAAENAEEEEAKMVRPERIELPTSWFVAMRSIQLSYGRSFDLRLRIITETESFRRT
jgi:hypothetical protein